VEERPEVLGDLWALYRLDFYEAVKAPRVDVLQQCMARLAVEPGSIWRAKELGGEKWFGWSMQSSLQADLIDAINFQTSATATNKKAKLKNPVERPDPKSKPVEVRSKSVSSMNWGSALSRLV